MSCLFNSLSVFVEGDDSNILRQKICNYLALNLPLGHEDVLAEQYIQWQGGVTLFEYVQQMRNIQTWGSSIEIQAFCELYSISVSVTDLRRSTNNVMTFIPKSGIYSKQVKLTWNGGHYEVSTKSA